MYMARYVQASCVRYTTLQTDGLTPVGQYYVHECISAPVLSPVVVLGTTGARFSGAEFSTRQPPPSTLHHTLHRHGHGTRNLTVHFSI